ncbi:hypothetical protein [Glycomyces buryatensis]|uniref:DUF59 domain-containing protein n=1 Tax=Glycomyces buryatensis TaxID=2570927 RepID=A0A4S8Q818_9ACTN|nr:hypothetical protein [Glycomyces buryatensis]THV36474.1 hypothetical protein FAB82_22085 [Glycomyces buryatensis]
MTNAMPPPTPEDLGAAPLWENYIIAQATQASLGLIPRNALALGVTVDGLDVTVTCQLQAITRADKEDLREIAQELTLLLGAHVNVTSAHHILESPVITPHDAASWIFVARADAA